MKGAFTIILIGILLTSSFVSQASPVFGDPKLEKEESQIKNQKNILGFNKAVIMSTSSTTTICHIPPGNPNNAHTIIVGTSSLTAHLKHNDKKGECTYNNLEIQEFTTQTLETSSDTLSKAKEFMNNIVLNVSSDSKIGPAISEAAQLHKLFAHEDKETKKEFQEAFLEFIKNVKKEIGKGKGETDRAILNDLGKAAIKISSLIKNDERKDEHKNKIQTALNLKIEKESLQKIRNQISMAKINHDTNNKKFDTLLEDETKILTKVLISEAKSNGEKITIEKIKQISKKSSEISENNHKSNSNNQSSDKNSKNESKDKSDKSKSDKKPKKSSGKSKGKGK